MQSIHSHPLTVYKTHGSLTRSNDKERRHPDSEPVPLFLDYLSDDEQFTARLKFGVGQSEASYLYLCPEIVEAVTAEYPFETSLSDRTEGATYHWKSGQDTPKFHSGAVEITASSPVVAGATGLRLSVNHPDNPGGAIVELTAAQARNLHDWFVKLHDSHSELTSRDSHVAIATDGARTEW